jgi:hypothetical protein
MRLGIGEVEVARRNVTAGTVGGRCVVTAGAEARAVGVGGHSGEAACVAVGRRCMASTVLSRTAQGGGDRLGQHQQALCAHLVSCCTRTITSGHPTMGGQQERGWTGFYEQQQAYLRALP